MKKFALALAVLAAAAGSAFAVSQATAHNIPSCFCTPTIGCSCD